MEVLSLAEIPLPIGCVFLFVMMLENGDEKERKRRFQLAEVDVTATCVERIEKRALIATCLSDRIRDC